ncbi:hypothetical protein BV898_00843 [Hypsibius exemplaris]|uniref:SAM domain-containing protein n=1 Tax=Hypsibius exemplaris TaxID=2072580 RepID=A0A1W0XCB8_HYPEX|nr:hypothetical protein BV898_00843 [Hypsibius exemplaris]
MTNSSSNSRVCAAGAECDDDFYDDNPFGDSSDDDDFDIRVSQIKAISTPGRGAGWDNVPEDGTEEDVLFGVQRRRIGAGWDLPLEKSRVLRSRRIEKFSDDETNPDDPQPDRQLKTFLKAFGLKEAYDALRMKGIDLRQLLTMNESQLITIGFGDQDKLAVRRRLLYAIGETHNPVAEPPAEGSSNLDELKQQVGRNMGSVQQQLNSAKPLLGFMAAATEYLKGLTRDAASKETVFEEDIHETLINASDLAAAADTLKDRLLDLRKMFANNQIVLPM